MPSHTAEISHEYAAGASGPARSYWDVFSVDERGYRSKVGQVCQPPTAGATDWGHLDIPGLIHMLDAAFESGRRHKAAEIREVLGF